VDTDPVLIDSSWFAAQIRARLFWGNEPGLGKTVISEVDIKLQDCLLPNMNRRAMVEKIQTVTTKANSLHQGKSDYTCKAPCSPLLSFSISHLKTTNKAVQNKPDIKTLKL
jgi:hypothetical protein